MISRALGAARAIDLNYVVVPGSQLVQLAAGFGLTLTLAGMLGPDDFGAFAFFIACLGLLGAFSEFGVFSAAARLIAREEDDAVVRRLLGGGVAVAGAIYVGFCVLIALGSFVVDPIFDIGVGESMLLAAPLCGGVALELVILFLCQGTGRYRLLALNNLVARPLPFVLIVALSLAGDISLQWACILYVAGPTLAAALVLYRLRPDFTDVRGSVRAIRVELRSASDLGLWFGRALGTSTYNMDRLLVAYFLTPAAVSYYALAFALTMPIVVGAQGVTSVLYRRLVSSAEIAGRIIAGCAVWLAASGVLVAGAVVVVVELILDDYDPVLTILFPAVATAVVMGAVQLPNWFLMAQGRGRILRDIALVYTGANLVLNFTLIPAFGLKGAAYASLGAAAVSLALHVIRYRSVTRTPGGTPAPSGKAVATL